MLSYGGVNLSLSTPQHAEYLSSTFTLRRLAEFGRVFWPLNRTPWLTFPGQAPDRPLKLGALTWPRGASRFATFFAVVSDAVLNAIRAAGAPAQPLPLLMQWGDASAGSSPASISPSMWMLPALPLSQITGQNGHSLLTLVDDRYWWWFRPESTAIVDGVTMTWDILYGQLFAALNIPGGNYSWDPIDLAYLVPPRLFTTNFEYLPLLLDAIAYNVGQRIVFHLDGSVKGRSVLNGAADVAANLALPSARSLMAGGAFLPSDVLSAIPATAVVSFPFYSGNVVQPTPFVAAGPTGGNAPATKSFHDTANYDGSNAGQLQTLALRVALDYGEASVQVGDWKWAGIVPWVPDPIHDAVEWVIAGEGGPLGGGEVSTRVYPAPWNDLTDQLLHGSEAGSSTINACCTVVNNSVTTVNDCTLTASPGITQGLVINLCDDTINYWTGFIWLTFCTCHTYSGSGLPSGASGPCVPGVCSFCVNPPFTYTVPAAGFTGTLAPLNGPWVLAWLDNCRWAATRTVGATQYYASYVVGSSAQVLGFLDLTHGLTLAVYNAGPVTGQNCCLPVTLNLSSGFGGGGGGGTNTNCSLCGTTTPLFYALPVGGATGDFAVFNGSWDLQNSASYNAGCGWIWTLPDGSSITLTLNAGPPVGYQLTFETSGGSIAVYVGSLAGGDCCQAQAVNGGVTIGTGTMPSELLLTPDCESGTGDAPPALVATPTCCPTSSGSGGGGGTVQTPCCPNPVSRTLYLRFTNPSANVTWLLADNPISLVYQGVVGGAYQWLGTFPLKAGCPTTGSIFLNCTGAGQWTLTSDSCLLIESITVKCPPGFRINASSVQVFANPTCCTADSNNGTVDLTVTDT